MFITPSFKKSLIVEQFQGNYLNLQNLKKDGSGRSLGEGGGGERLPIKMSGMFVIPLGYKLKDFDLA